MCFSLLYLIGILKSILLFAMKFYKAYKTSACFINSIYRIYIWPLKKKPRCCNTETKLEN